MKLLAVASLALAAVGVIAIPSPQGLPEPSDNICLPVCHQEKPECAPGEAPTGGPGCWGCCYPIPADAPAKRNEGPEASGVCLAICHLEKPECKPGEAPTGGPGCWGCCQPVEQCLDVCHWEKPECKPGEYATGGPGCWGCCQPIDY